ncbi:hypothetical protein [Actinoplanes sp. NPDC049265]|uniref:hypothetical protein n=1 Tax=Actinoplanes sp. NPDC049265 TaxID=3363902 RepID=UPI0037230F32
MRRQGFAYTVVEPAPDPGDFPYGNDDALFAARHGFGIAYAKEAVDATRERDPNRRYLAGLSAERREAYGVALDGDRADPVRVVLPDGAALHQSGRGCTSDAQRRLYGDLAAWLRTRTLVERLALDAGPGVAADPRYRAALATWAACMSRRGYRVTDPQHLRELVPPATHGGPGAAEIRAATAEAGCASGARLVTTAGEVERSLADRAYIENREVIEEYQRLSVRALTVAQLINRQLEGNTGK